MGVAPAVVAGTCVALATSGRDGRGSGHLWSGWAASGLVGMGVAPATSGRDGPPLVGTDVARATSGRDGRGIGHLWLLAGWLAGWLAGGLAGWLVGCLPGWLAGGRPAEPSALFVQASRSERTPANNLPGFSLHVVLTCFDTSRMECLLSRPLSLRLIFSDFPPPSLPPQPTFSLHVFVYFSQHLQYKITLCG